MRIIFELGHPAHFFLYRNIRKRLRERGDEILIVVRDREDMVSRLLDEAGEKYVLLGPTVNGLLGKAVYMVRNDAKLLRIAAKFKPDLFISVNSPYSAHVSCILGKPHITWADSDLSKLILALLAPFTDTIITPTSFRRKFSFKNHVRVDSHKELAYLHPKYYKPKREILEEIGVGGAEKKVLMRFSSLDASHDFGLQGLTRESKVKLVRELSKIARVLVSSETDLGPELKEFEISLDSVGKMHDLLAAVDLFLGEGATMATEAAVLGTPSVFIYPNNIGCMDDLETQGMIVQYHRPNDELEDILEYCRKVLTDESMTRKHSVNRKIMIENKVDLNEHFMREIDRFRNES